MLFIRKRAAAAHVTVAGLVASGLLLPAVPASADTDIPPPRAAYDAAARRVRRRRAPRTTSTATSSTRG